MIVIFLNALFKNECMRFYCLDLQGGIQNYILMHPAFHG
jgi:hypothetical protein